MILKRLLLGAAAAIVATTGAKAADPIIYAEPEPTEYVRICDVYGAGFYYIPGTETCLKISGFVRYQIRANSNWDYWQKRVRARLNFDARTDTAWGLLRSYIRVQGGWFDPANQVADQANIPLNTTDGEVFIDHAYLELGGVRMGYTESAWVQYQGSGVASYGSHSDSGLSYAYQQRALIGYTFTGGNGFSANITLEDDGNTNFMPDIVGGVAVNQGWGGIWAKAAYDEDIGPAIGARAAGLSGVDGWGAQAGAQINVPNAPGSSLRVIGYYANNNNAYSVGSRWSALASYGHQFSPEWFASTGFQWFGDTNYGAVGSPSAWQGELNLVWSPLSNLEIRGEYNYFKAQNVSGVHSGFIWFERSF